MYAVQTPPIEPLREMVRRFSAHGIEVALGGSGLLHALGLAHVVNDWDLTTDAPLEQVLEVMGPDVQFGSRTAPYTSEALLTQGHIEVIVRFGVNGEHFPTVVCGEWEGIPLGDPCGWARAYRAMGRPQKADLLRNSLACARLTMNHSHVHTTDKKQLVRRTA
jgi:hypothetical protein